MFSCRSSGPSPRSFSSASFRNSFSTASPAPLGLGDAEGLECDFGGRPDQECGVLGCRRVVCVRREVTGGRLEQPVGFSEVSSPARHPRERHVILESSRGEAPRLVVGPEHRRPVLLAERVAGDRLQAEGQVPQAQPEVEARGVVMGGFLEHGARASSTRSCSSKTRARSRRASVLPGSAAKAARKCVSAGWNAARAACTTARW